MQNKKFLSETDEQLMKLFQLGNRDAFNEICLRYKDKAVNFLFRFVGDRAMAQDLAQNSFLKVYINKDSYREIAKFSTWFYTIASNLAKTELRKNKRRQTLPFSAVGADDREFIASAPIDEHEDDAYYLKTKTEISTLTKAKKALTDLEIASNETKRIHKCYHDESPPKPCEIIG